MKFRVRDRLIVSLAGLVLAAGAAALCAQAFFGVDLCTRVANFVAKRDLKHIVVSVVAILALCALGVYCFLMLFRRGRRKSGFVVQHTDAGELSISVKALEGLVQKCIDKHEELHVVSTSLDNTRDGLIVKLRIGLAGGVNIPLAAGALQKQIKQYVTACSGVDVKEVRVQVDTTAAKVKESVYAVEENVGAAPLVMEQPAVPEVEQPVKEEKKVRRPLHQRLFGRQDQPEILPMPPVPPELEKKAEAEDAPEAAPEEEPAEITDSEQPAAVEVVVTEEAPEEETAEAEEAAEAEEPAEDESAEEEKPEVTEHAD